jgi:hypothetical protein
MFVSNIVHGAFFRIWCCPSSAAAQSIVSFPVTEKLTRSSFTMWKPQVWSALRGAQLA